MRCSSSAPKSAANRGCIVHSVSVSHGVQGKKVCFVSNNSSKSRAEYLQRFRKLGMTAYEVTSYVLKMYVATLHILCVEHYTEEENGSHRRRCSVLPMWLHTTSSTV